MPSPRWLSSRRRKKGTTTIPPALREEFKWQVIIVFRYLHGLDVYKDHFHEGCFQGDKCRIRRNLREDAEHLVETEIRKRPRG